MVFKLGRWVTAGAVVLASLGAIVPADASAAPSRLYVSPDGHGSWCSKVLPCGLDAVKPRVTALTAHQNRDVVVSLRGGTYRLAKPFELGPADSGRNGFSVTYQASPGEKPVLTGARRITGFRQVDAATNIYRASVPTGTDTRQLFVEGVRAERARTALNPAAFTVTPTGFTTPDPSFAAFTGQTGVEVVQDNKWKHMRCPLSSITPSATGGSTLTVQPTCWSNNNLHVVNRQFPFNGNGLPKLDNVSWLENAYQLLTRPGQWYLDKSASALYYIPRAGERMSTADVELPVLSTLVSAVGTPGHLAPVDDTDPHSSYSGSWQTAGNRGFGDYQDGVHVTNTQGSSVTYSFYGTGLDVLAETSSDLGTFDAFVDGKRDTSAAETGQGRLAQQVVHSVKGLRKGPHTVTLTSTSTASFLVDAFVVTPDVVAPVHDLTFSGLTFTGTTWLLPSVDGYIDNQAGVQWAAKAPWAPIRAPGAVEVHRGRGISFSDNVFTHLGGTGLALADGTQESTVDHNRVSDTSGTGIALGEVDDYYLTDPARMTSSDTVSGNTVDTPGQDYHDAVGIWTGHGRRILLSHNEISSTPYSGISLGWGWGYASACDLQAKQGLPTCRRGTLYGGENKILGNRIHDVMSTLFDGGAIYTLGGQEASELAGNWVSAAPHNNNMLYHDEGSSFWNTHDNVVSNPTGTWVGMWTPTIHDLTIHDNFTDNPAVKNKGTAITITGTTLVTDGQWPPAAQAVMAAAGPH